MCCLNVFSDVLFYPRVLQKFMVSKTIPAPVCLVALMIWHSCSQTSEVCGPKMYQSENKVLPLKPLLNQYKLLVQLTTFVAMVYSNCVQLCQQWYCVAIW